MTTESELRLENRQLREERDVLQLRQENRALKREIERLKKSKKWPEGGWVNIDPYSHKRPLLSRVLDYLVMTLMTIGIVLVIVKGFRPDLFM